MLLLFDENIPHKLAEGLNHIEQGNFKSLLHFDVTHPKLEKLEGAPDEDIIAFAGKKKAVIVSFDKDFKHHKHYYALYKQHKVGVVLYRQPKKAVYWDLVQIFVKHWEELKNELYGAKPPFIFEINSRGIQRLEF